MATIDIDFYNLKKELKKEDLTINEFEDILFDFGLEVDSYDPESDTVKVEVTAERVDLLSFPGLVRALKSYVNSEKYIFPEIKDSGYSVNITTDARDYGNYTMCAIVKNLELDDSKIKEIIDVQEKLHVTYGRKRKSVAIGVYPLDKIKFPITLDAKDPDQIKFIPLGESREMSGSEIITQHPTGIAYAKLVESKKKYLVFTDYNNNVLSMPPIINSQETGRVCEQTKNLFIECTGTNLSKLKYTISIISEMFRDFGGEVYSLTLNYPDKTLTSPDSSYLKMNVSLDYLNKLIGVNVDINKAKELLERMMYSCKIINDNQLEVVIPNFRSDVIHVNDIADDFGRAYGFNNIVPKNSRVVSIAERLPDSIKQENIINTFVGMGFQEVMPFVLSSEKESFDNFLINKDLEKYIKLDFSAESSLNIVGNWILPKLLKVFFNNQNKSFPQKIFACDYVVKKDDSKDVLSKTVLHTACMIANSKISFTEISSVLLGLCNTLNKKLELKKQDYSYYIPGRSATVLIDNKVVGTIGEINPDVLLNNNYTNPVCGFEIEI